jgi:hypothetical protein
VTRRVILGQHPAGPIGLFVSRPGIDVFTADPGSITDLSFSTEWGQVASVVASGLAAVDSTVYLPAAVIGIPVIWWARMGTNTIVPFDFFGYFASHNNTNYFNSRFHPVVGGEPGARTLRFQRRSPYDSAGGIFRYIVFNLE